MHITAYQCLSMLINAYQCSSNETENELWMTALEQNPQDKMATLLLSDMYEYVTFDDGYATCNDSKICNGIDITCSESHEYETCIGTVVHINCSELSQVGYTPLINDKCHHVRADDSHINSMTDGGFSDRFNHMTMVSSTHLQYASNSQDDSFSHLKLLSANDGNTVESIQ
jgi:hypothetical protein